MFQTKYSEIFIARVINNPLEDNNDICTYQPDIYNEQKLITSNMIVNRNFDLNKGKQHSNTNKHIALTRKKKSFETNTDKNILISNNTTTISSILRKIIKNDMVPNSTINYINNHSRSTMPMNIYAVSVINQ